MKILVLQLKRIGDLVLTAPALAALRRRFPQASITLAVADGAADLLPAFAMIDRGWVFRRKGFNAAFWRELIKGRFDVCLDLTGTDRSALCTLLSRGAQRLAYSGVSGLRARVYNDWVDSAVRDVHTVDHFLAMALRVRQGAGEQSGTGVPPVVSEKQEEGEGALILPESARDRAVALLGAAPYVVVHPGTARAEKYWVAERWAALIAHVQREHGLRCVLTGGPDAFEQAHLAQIQRGLKQPCLDLSGKIDLLTFAAVLGRARAVLSCDTAAVHLAAGFARPQIALYGVTNPFHWRPRHAAAVVLSAAHPAGALREFAPRMKGAPMSGISTDVLIHATDGLLRAPAPGGSAEQPVSG